MNIFRFLVAFFCAFVLPAHAATIRGKVLAPDGAPVVGAAIWAGEAGLFDYSEKDGSLRRLKSDGDGAFVFEIAEKPGETPMAFVRVLSEKWAVADAILNVGDNVIVLSAPQGVRGAVLDVRGKPVAGAVVRAGFCFDLTEEFDVESGVQTFASMMAWLAALPPVETLSGAAGQWVLPLFDKGQVLLRDPRFAYTSATVGEENLAPVLLARPPATLRGTVVTPGGVPLPGARLWPLVSEDFFSISVRSDSQGRFVIDHLPPEPNAMIVGTVPGEEWLLPVLRMPGALKADAANDVPPWMATRGVEITGQVVDAKNGAPVAGAKVGQPFGSVQNTDAQGRFRLRVLTADASLDQVFVVAHERYVTSQEQVPESAKAPHDVGLVKMSRLVTARGQLLDEKDRPVPGVMLSMSFGGPQWNADRSVKTGPDGSFAVRVAAGKAEVESASEEWEILPDKAVEVEVVEGKMLQIKARRVALHEVKGRVVDSQKRPVAYAVVTVNASVPDGAGDFDTMTKEAQSGVDGTYSVRFAGTINALGIERARVPGYVLRRAGQGQKTLGTWRLSDTMLSALSGQISGRVLNAVGAPVAGALVAAPEALGDESVVTDAQGRFTLNDVPDDGALVFAAHGRNFARGVAQNNAIELRLLPAGVLVAPMRAQLMSKFIKSGSQLTSYWNELGSEKILALALQKDGALTAGEMSPAKTDWNKAGAATLSMLRQAVRNDAPWLRQNGAALLAKIIRANKNAEVRRGAETALAVAWSLGDEKERAAAKSWLDAAIAETMAAEATVGATNAAAAAVGATNAAAATAAKDVPGDALHNATRWFQLAGVAGALGDARAQAFTLKALAFANRVDAKVIRSNVSVWGNALGVGGAELFGAGFNEWPMENRIRMLSSAVSATAPLDLARARALWEKLRALEHDPAYKKYREDATSSFASLAVLLPALRTNLLLAQAETDPAGALQASAQGEQNDRVLLLIARVARRQGDKELATRALRPLLSGASAPYSSFQNYAYASAMAGFCDKPLAAQLWSRAEAKAQRVVAVGPQNDREAWREIAELAFYSASFEPAQARLRLETAWQRGRDVMKTTGEMRLIWPLAGAMVALDPVRAVEMLGEITDEEGRAYQQRRLAAYLLVAEPERALLPPE